MILEKPKLFTETKHFLLFVVVIIAVILSRLGFEYHSYVEFANKPFYYTHAEVIKSYPKKKSDKKYYILKLYTDDGKTVYTTTYKYHNLNEKRIYLQLIPNKKIHFWNYLGGMYCKSRIKKIEQADTSFKHDLENRISSQHRNKDMQAFYKAIFLASPLPGELRDRIASLGISHLVALSGFHLGILWGVLFGVLAFLYKPIHQRYFPYRYSLIDVGAIVMVLLGYYLWLTGFPPSLVRAYAMMLVGWIMVLMGIELVSFTFLSTVALTLLAMFPNMVVSLSFWLSVAGVFYIFLMLNNCKDVKVWLVSFVCIPIGIFILMQPIVHYFFGLTTPYQLLSPILSILFIIFYPVAFVIHLLGQGSLLDGGLQSLLAIPDSLQEEHLLPWQAVLVYLLLSIGAIWHRTIFYILLIVALCYMVYIFS